MPAVAKSVLLRMALYFIGPALTVMLDWGTLSIISSFALAALASLLHIYYRNIYVSLPVFLMRLAGFTAIQLMIAAVFRYQLLSAPVDHIPHVEAPPVVPMAGKMSSDFLSIQPKVTMSIVLPCANEGKYSWMTAQSIAEVTPDDVLREIIVVDDGSSPPLMSQFPKDIVEKAKVRFLRHESHTGLINAKSAGANVATGDIIVFLDCHVRPAPEWHKSIIEKIRSNYRRVVVPSITGLDPDTWQEVRGNGGLAKCYLTWDADFKWFDSDDDTVGVMSGGLLAMSRQWWIETGGYDTEMKGWGGENLDQSLRIWLCGGEIVQATDSFVGHMWRTHEKPQTAARYTVPAGSVTVNRYRGASVWMGEWSEKLETFPSFTQFKSNKPDVGNIQSVKDRLQCKHFSYFIDKFYKVYHWGGLLPAQVFKLRDSRSGLCLERQGADNVLLSQCSDDNSGQLWHKSNRDGERCCSGYRNWNSDQCLSGGWIGSKLKTFVCNVGGVNQEQFITLDKKTQQLELTKRPGACIGGKLAERPKASFAKCGDSSFTQRFKKIATQHSLASPADNDVEYVRLEDADRPGACLAGMGESGATGRVEIHDCDEKSTIQKFGIRKLPSGEIRVEAVGLIPTSASGNLVCLDAGLGVKQIGLYPCYTETNANQNLQIIETGSEMTFKFRDDLCLSIAKNQKEPTADPMTLHGCVVDSGVVKRGQSFEKVFPNKNDLTVFALKNKDGLCLSVNQDKAFVMTRAGCDKDLFKQDPSDSQQRLVHVASSLCVDGNDGVIPTLYTCYAEHNPNQQVDVSNGYVKIQHTNTCLDFEPVQPSLANIVSCAVSEANFRWEEYQPFVPVETKLYNAHKEKQASLASSPQP